MRAQNKGRKRSPGWVLQAGPPALLHAVGCFSHKLLLLLLVCLSRC